MNNIEVLLKAIKTEEGKAKAVSLLIDEYSVPLNYIDDAIDYFERRGKENTLEGIKAAEIAKKANMPERSRAILEKVISKEEGGMKFYYAASIARKAGMEERAIELFDKDSRDKERDKNFYFAAKSAEDAGMEERAKKLFAKAVGDHKSALSFYSHFGGESIVKIINETIEKAEMENQKQRLYEETIESQKERFSSILGEGLKEAAWFAEKAGMEERAKELTIEAINAYATNGDYSNAIILADKAKLIKTLDRGIKKKILSAMEKNRINEAVDMAERMAMPEQAVSDLAQKAMEKYDAEGNFKEAARFAKKAGMTETTKCYEALNELLGRNYQPLRF